LRRGMIEDPSARTAVAVPPVAHAPLGGSSPVSFATAPSCTASRRFRLTSHGAGLAGNSTRPSLVDRDLLFRNYRGRGSRRGPNPVGSYPVGVHCDRGGRSR